MQAQGFAWTSVDIFKPAASEEDGNKVFDAGAQNTLETNQMLLTEPI